MEQTNNNALVATPQAETLPMDPMMGLVELKKRAEMVTEIKRQIMRDNVHYGVIPGCGSKPTLLKNGAELLCMAFKLAPDAKVEIQDLGNGHREYTVTTTLVSITTGTPIATGLGSCSTMESKYRYRGNELENTGKPVPKEYWNSKDPAVLGGRGFTAKKDENGAWMIFRKGDKKSENPDIADVYNTVLKMASKRSLIDATLKATGGSCEFTQDLEDMKQNASANSYQDYEDYGYAEPAAPQAAQPARQATAQATAPAPRNEAKAAPKADNSALAGFKARLKAMEEENPDAYEYVKQQMKDNGWARPSNVPEGSYATVESWFNIAKMQEVENG